jgi:streptogramin lyase
MKRSSATILREYGPFPGVSQIGGVSYDGANIWIAAGDSLNAINAESGETARKFDLPAHAGTAFDSRHLFQLSGEHIQKIDPDNGRVLATIPAPEGGASGMAWAEGSLWVGQHRARKIHQVDPETGRILRSLDSNRFVTGVTWADGELWHATWENDESELRRIDPTSGAVLEQVGMPKDIAVSGLEWNGRDAFYCGGATSGKVRVVKKPR